MTNEQTPDGQLRDDNSDRVPPSSRTEIDGLFADLDRDLDEVVKDVGPFGPAGAAVRDGG